MATNGEESLGKTMLRGAAWGIGFTVAVGALRWGWQQITAESSDDDETLYPEIEDEED